VIKLFKLFLTALAWSPIAGMLSILSCFFLSKLCAMYNKNEGRYCTVDQTIFWVEHDGYMYLYTSILIIGSIWSYLAFESWKNKFG